MRDENLVQTGRYEIKFTTNSAHYDYLKQWVETHQMGFYAPYPPRKVNNIYFDTLDLDSYLENMAGISSRTKMRLRWYGETEMMSKPTLELKVKKNKLGWKKSAKIPLECSPDSISYETLNETIHQNIDEDLSNRFNQTDNPILLNRYEREYFESRDRKVRVTIDRGIQFFDQRLHESPNFIFMGNVPEIVILEIKTAAEDFDKASLVLKDFPMPPTKSSKYVIGVQSILGY